VIELDDIESRIADGIYGDDRLHRAARNDAFSALAEILAEVERLRADRAWLVEEVLSQTGATADELAACMAAPAHMPVVNRRMGEAIRERLSDRAAVVAWLREQRQYGTDELIGHGFATVCNILADAIERGEHREGEP